VRRFLRRFGFSFELLDPTKKTKAAKESPHSKPNRPPLARQNDNGIVAGQAEYGKSFLGDLQVVFAIASSEQGRGGAPCPVLAWAFFRSVARSI